jgi:hypothetical protein
MVERAPFLNTAYSAYYHRERPTEDEELMSAASYPSWEFWCRICSRQLIGTWLKALAAQQLGPQSRVQETHLLDPLRAN